jgi:hypothetical protein
MPSSAMPSSSPVEAPTLLDQCATASTAYAQALLDYPNEVHYFDYNGLEIDQSSWTSLVQTSGQFPPERTIINPDQQPALDAALALGPDIPKIVVQDAAGYTRDYQGDGLVHADLGAPACQRAAPRLFPIAATQPPAQATAEPLPSSAPNEGNEAAWNRLPHAWLDCSFIPLGNATQVDAVTSHDVGGDHLTFVTRACKTGDGSGSVVMAVYKGSVSNPSLVGTMLTNDDNASDAVVTVQGSTVTVEATVHLESDSNCCPTGHLERKFAYASGRITPTA